MRAITRGRASLGGRLGSQSLPGCQWGRLNDTACSFAGQRRCLYKARHFPCCDGAVSCAGRTAHGTLLFTYGPYGMLRDAKRVLGLCATENFCSPQLRVCKNIAPVRVSDPYFSSSKTLQRCSISSSPAPWSNHCYDTFNFILFDKKPTMHMLFHAMRKRKQPCAQRGRRRHEQPLI